MSENRLFKAVFKGAWVVLAGVEYSPQIRRISANGISAKRVSTFSTLSAVPVKRTAIVLVNYSPPE